MTLVSAAEITMREFKSIAIDSQHCVWLGVLPPELRWTPALFEAFWTTHPHAFHKVRIFGKLVAVPRWSQTYGRDY